jgi:hypothetical protein
VSESGVEMSPVTTSAVGAAAGAADWLPSADAKIPTKTVAANKNAPQERHSDIQKVYPMALLRLKNQPVMIRFELVYAIEELNGTANRKSGVRAARRRLLDRETMGAHRARAHHAH